MGSTTVPSALRRAATLARAFILLEDPALGTASAPDGTDDDPGRAFGARGPAGVPVHPHRVSPRSRQGARRPGAVVRREQPCLAPLARPAGRRERARIA